YGLYDEYVRRDEHGDDWVFRGAGSNRVVADDGLFTEHLKHYLHELREKGRTDLPPPSVKPRHLWLLENRARALGTTVAVPSSSVVTQASAAAVEPATVPVPEAPTDQPEPDRRRPRDEEDEPDAEEPVAKRPRTSGVEGDPLRQLADELALIHRHLAAFPAESHPYLRARAWIASELLDRLRENPLEVPDVAVLTRELAVVRELAAHMREPLAGRRVANDIAWLPLADANGKHNVLAMAANKDAAELAADVSKYNDLGTRLLEGVDYFTNETVEVVADWANDTSTIRLYLEADGDSETDGSGFLVRLKDDRRVVVPPHVMAQLVAASEDFQRMTAGLVRPTLLLQTENDDDVCWCEELNIAMLGHLRQLTGPWRAFHHEGMREHNKDGVLLEGHGFSPGPALTLSGVRYDALGDGITFDLRRPARERVATSKETLVVRLTGSGRAARVVLSNGVLMDLGGAEIGALVLGHAGFQAFLEKGWRVLLDTDVTEVRVNYGGLGFDFAGALRKENIFNDVYLRSADGKETLVSVPRAGDLQTAEILDNVGELLGEFVRYVGDDSKLNEVRTWASRTDFSSYQLDGQEQEVKAPRGYLYFVRPNDSGFGYLGLRTDGKALDDVRPGDLGRYLGDDPKLRDTMGQKGAGSGAEGVEEPFVWLGVERPVIGLEEIARSYVSAGFSRTTWGSLGEVQFGADGILNMVGGGLARIVPIAPGPEHLASYDRASAKLGVRGQFFPTGAFERALWSLNAIRDRPLNNWIYWVLDAEGDAADEEMLDIAIPYLSPSRAYTARTLIFESHSVENLGFVFRMNTNRPHHLGDIVRLSGAPSANAITGSQMFRLAGEVGELIMISCSGDAFSQANAISSASQMRECWDRGLSRPRIIAPSDVVIVMDASSARVVENGGHFREVLPPGSVQPEPIPLSDLATNQIDPVWLIGDDQTNVRRAARRVARSAMWRLVNDAPLPKVTVSGYGVDYAAGQAQAGRAAAIFYSELVSEFERLHDMQRPVTSKVPLRVFAMTYADLQPGMPLGDAQVTVALDYRELGGSAVTQRFDRYEATMRAFARLDPGCAHSATTERPVVAHRNEEPPGIS
ncbi:hypothetical protein AB0H34_47060, partial [Saccharopolyspora shandongensis]|uniref:hypothetical protein n=1 Tax=Saccharopolyspora shandongensis TaxID=418495 RepID=UPI0033E2A159